MNKLYVFDMDGTLLPETTANIELARVMGKEKELRYLEKLFTHGEIDTFGFAKEIFDLWGMPPKEVVREAFMSTKKMENIEQTVNNIKKAQDMVALITMSPDYYANYFYEYGFDFIFASRFPKNVSDSMDYSHILRPEDKPMIVKMLCERLNLDMTNVVAFGDSMSDYPLFDVVEQTISVNGDDRINNCARYSYQGNDLNELFLTYALI